MKKLFTLAIGLVALLSMQAQIERANQNSVIYPQMGGNNKIANRAAKPSVHRSGSSRATNFSFQVDYSGFEESYAAENNADFFETLVQMNRTFPYDSVGTARYGVVIFDTLIDIYTDGAANIYPHYRYPYQSLTALKLDTLYIGLAHVNTSGTRDTLRVSVYDLTTNTNIRVDSGFVGAPIWRQDIITDTSLTGAGTQPGQYQVRYLPLAVNLTIPGQHKIAIQVDYFGNINDEFFFLSGYRNDCGPCGASSFSAALPSATGSRFDPNLNSILAYNFGRNAQNQPVAYFSDNIGYDCNGNQALNFEDCEADVAQNLQIIPQFIVDIPFGATVTSDSAKTCPNQTVPITASAYGSTGPYTYNWSVTGGTAASLSDATINVFVNGTASLVANVTVTDAANNTVTASYTLPNRAIVLSITNTNPFQIACGSTNNTITTQAAGYTQGPETYVWNALNGTQANLTGVSTPGTYSVTVTNSVGCTATASVAVAYPGVFNTATFTPPTDVNTALAGIQVCPNIEQTFTNTSQSTANGWTSLWTWGNGDISTLTNGKVTYTPGVYSVTLTMDSAGCKFVSAPVSISVLQATASQCIVGIDDITFDSQTSIVPNPTNGNVTISVIGAEKNVSVKIYNVIGSEVKSFNSSDVTSNFNKTFDLSDFANGTYLVKIQSGSKVSVKRLFINK
jgi:hypothetical protein